MSPARIVVLVVVASGGCGDHARSTDSGTAIDGAATMDGGAAMDAMARDAEAEHVDSSVDAFRPDAWQTDAGSPALPPAGGMFDYQLGEAYPPPVGVSIVSGDRNAAPEPGIYNICYVNGFQTQPDERSFWTADHPDLLLRDEGGDLVIDPDWDEIILDVTTPEKRAMLAEIVGGWIDGCGDDGFDAIEIDNLDTYSRSGGLVSEDDAVRFMRLLADRAHARGLAIAQKNSTDVVGRRAEMGTDFVIAEECNRYNECEDYTDGYGDQVYVIEYRRSDFDSGCRDFPHLSLVLRDLLLVGPSSASYVFDSCR